MSVLTMDEVPIKERLQAADASIERQRNIQAANRTLTTTLNQLSEGCVKDVQGLIAKTQLRAYTSRHSETMKSIADIPVKYRATTDGLRQEKEFRRGLVKRSQEYVATLGVDLKKVEGIQKDYIKRSGEALRQQLEPKEEAPYVILDPKETPKETHNPWAWMYPPYVDEWGTQWSYGTRGGRWVSHYENRYTGQIGNQNQMWLYGSDDSDYGYTNGMSEVWVWYRMPAAGMVEAWLYLQCIDSRYGGCMDDEWGWSDIDVYQRSKPYMEVFYPAGGRRYGTLLDFHMGECDCCWSGRVANAYPGDFRYSHLFSTQSYAANQWLLIAFGIHDYNYFWTNDMSCDTYMLNNWFMHHLAIRSTGAP
ncbi:MAG TPA: hypothetical protein VGB32_07600 [Candidatus Bathyarchaeia archaeon]